MNKRSAQTQEIPATAVPPASFVVHVRQAEERAATTVGTATPSFDPKNDNLSSKPLRRPNRLRPLASDSGD